MKILMLSFNQRGKGTWLRAFNLANELVNSGNQVTLLCSDGSNSKKDSLIEHTNGLVEVNFHPTFPGKYLHGWDLGEAARRRNWLKRRKFDIVHVFEHRPTNQIPALFSQKQGALMISDWADWLGKGGSVEERRKLLLKTLLSCPETMFEESGRKKASGCTAINLALYQKAKNLGFPEGKLLWLPNGYYNSQLTATPIKTARKILGLSEDVFLVGYLGTCFYSDSLIMQNTLQQAASENQKIKFLQIGKNKFCPKNMNNLINVGLVSIENLSLYLSACNVFWLPLADTGANAGRSPYKFGDYLTIGRPIISTNVGDQANLIKDYNLGLITNDSAKSLFAAIQFLNSDIKTCEELGHNAYNFARIDENSWQEKGRKLNAFYCRLQKEI